MLLQWILNGLVKIELEFYNIDNANNANFGSYFSS